jgi:hypothetical protein
MIRFRHRAQGTQDSEEREHSDWVEALYACDAVDKRVELSVAAPPDELSEQAGLRGSKLGR